MITTGIIREIAINKGSFIGNAYKVELNIFQTPGDSDKNNYTYIANCSILPGVYNSYNIGDLVYVGFLNNNKSLPLILGKIYQGLEDKAGGKFTINSLEVKGNTQLSKDTKIEDISFKDLTNLVSDVSSLKKKTYYQHNITGTNGSSPAITFTIISKVALFTNDNISALRNEIERLYASGCLVGKDTNNKIYTISIDASNIRAAEVNQTSTVVTLNSIEDNSIAI